MYEIQIFAVTHAQKKVEQRECLQIALQSRRNLGKFWCGKKNRQTNIFVNGWKRVNILVIFSPLICPPHMIKIDTSSAKEVR